MKITIERLAEALETEVLIRCPESPDKPTEDLIGQLMLYSDAVVGYKDTEAVKVFLSEVYYIDCADEKAFLYTERDIYDTKQKLYEWEAQLEGTSFVRISKTTILNTDKVASVSPTVSGRLEAVMDNGEKQIVNRHYVSDFKKKFGI